MILTLQIDKLEPGTYSATVLHGDVEVCASSVHSSIEDAIRKEAAAVPEGFAQFVEPRYQEFSAGTMTLADAQARASELADRLVSLVATANAASQGILMSDQRGR